jgi:hypothetical protein
MTQPILQTVFNITDGQYGLRYVKIVKSPNGPHYVLDMMFTKGLRLFVNVTPGQSVQGIGPELEIQLMQYRASEYDIIKPSIDFVAECASRALADEFGKVVQRQLEEETLRVAWEQTRFHRFLRILDPQMKLPYEFAERALSDHYQAA